MQGHVLAKVQVPQRDRPLGAVARTAAGSGPLSLSSEGSMFSPPCKRGAGHEPLTLPVASVHGLLSPEGLSLLP